MKILQSQEVSALTLPTEETKLTDLDSCYHLRAGQISSWIKLISLKSPAKCSATGLGWACCPRQPRPTGHTRWQQYPRKEPWHCPSTPCSGWIPQDLSLKSSPKILWAVTWGDQLDETETHPAACGKPPLITVHHLKKQQFSKWLVLFSDLKSDKRKKLETSETQTNPRKP